MNVKIKRLTNKELEEYNSYKKMELNDLQKLGKFKRFKLLHMRLKESEHNEL